MFYQSCIFAGFFLQFIFLDKHLPEERSKILRTEEELKNLPDNSTNIFKRNTLDIYMDQPNHSFCQGRYSILDSFFLQNLFPVIRLFIKPKEVYQNEDYQPDALPDSLI